MQFEHFNISAPMPVLKRLVTFYAELFDWYPGFRPEFSRAGFWLYQGELAILHLTESDKHQAVSAPYLDHLAFRAENPKAFVAKLVQQDISFKQHKVPELNMLQLFFTDPAGTGLEVNFDLAGNSPGE